MSNNSTRQTRRGVIGIESAIVMIAFVIVAAALAFVVLNMGFSTTQKSKAAITSSVTEASSALEIAGKVTGVGQVSTGYLNATAIPLKIAGGGDSVNLDPANVAIKYYSSSVSYDNIYPTSCILTSTTYANLTLAMAAATPGCISANAITSNTSPTSTQAFIYWAVSKQTPPNKILETGENAVLAIAYAQADKPTALDNIKVEVIVPTGSALTVERTVPSVTTQVVDLG